MIKIAVLMCCYNRKEKTVDAINKIYNQSNGGKYKFDIYLLDDGSSDGTSESVQLKFPDVNVIKGDGSYFWNGGMRKAYNTAKQKEYDFYIWMNDDTFIHDNAFKILLDTNFMLNESKSPKIIVGTTVNKNGIVTYGGVKKVSPTRPVKYRVVTPDEKIQKNAIQLMGILY